LRLRSDSLYQSCDACACVPRSAMSFFFSSRRRHTRFSRDWSSDVGSSDLGPALLVFGHQTERRAHAQPQPDARIHFPGEIGVGQIGRASGREGVERAGVTVTDQGTKNTKTEDGKAEEVATTVATLQTVAIA